MNSLLSQYLSVVIFFCVFLDSVYDVFLFLTPTGVLEEEVSTPIVGPQEVILVPTPLP